MLAYALASRGASAVIVPMYEQAVDVPRLGLDALVVNYARDVNLDLMQSFAKAGLALYVLDTEGGVLTDKGSNSPPLMAAYMRNSGYANMLAGYFFWGGKLQAAFRDGEVMAPDRLHLSGCPRFDFAAPRWRKLLESGSQGYLLVNANFPFVNPRFATKPGAERDVMVKAGWDAAYLDLFQADLKQVFANYLVEIDRLAAARPDRPILSGHIRSKTTRSIAPPWPAGPTSWSTEPETCSSGSKAPRRSSTSTAAPPLKPCCLASCPSNWNISIRR